MSKESCLECYYRKGNVFHHCTFYGETLLVKDDDYCSNYKRMGKHTENSISNHYSDQMMIKTLCDQEREADDLYDEYSMSDEDREAYDSQAHWWDY